MNCVPVVSVVTDCQPRAKFYILLTVHLVMMPSPTQSDIYQMMYWYIWFSWWWALGCSKRVENGNNYIEKNCESSWSFTKKPTASLELFFKPTHIYRICTQCVMGFMWFLR